MATQLKNIVRFLNVAAGATVALPHGLAWSPPAGPEQPQIPDICIPSRGGFTVTADATNVTVTNNTAGILSVDVLVELWHTIERAFGDADITDLVPQPFVVNLDSGGGGGGAGAVLGFGLGTVTADLANIMLPWYESVVEGGEIAAIEMVAPRAGTLRNLFVRHNGVGTGGPVDYAVTLDGVPTALAVAALSSGAVGQGSDLVDSVVVAQGQRIGMIATGGELGGGQVAAVATMLFDD